MFAALATLILAFAGGLFLLLGGPLCLSTRARVFARGRRAPRWLQVLTSLGSRLAGIFVLVYWVWTVTHGEVLPFLLILTIFLIGFFLLFNGPIRLLSGGKVFAWGREAPMWLQNGAIWFSRVAGGGAILGGLFASLRHWFSWLGL